MGFFKNLILRSMANSGWVTGGAHQPDAIIITKEKGASMASGLMFLGVSKSVEFKKSDIASITVAETNARHKNGSNDYVGCRYKISFKDGETSIVFIVADRTSEFETLMVD